MRNLIFAIAAVSATTTLWVARTIAFEPQAQSADQAFIKEAGTIDLAEIKIGKMAQSQASSEVIKKYADKMVQDHTQMNKELRDMATKKGTMFPDKLDAKHQELCDELSKLKGSNFDQAYAKDMVAGHEKAIEKFEQESKNGQDSDVKAWASRWLPTLREHLRMAQDAVKTLKAQ